MKRCCDFVRFCATLSQRFIVSGYMIFYSILPSIRHDLTQRVRHSHSHTYFHWRNILQIHRHRKSTVVINKFLYEKLNLQFISLFIQNSIQGNDINTICSSLYYYEVALLGQRCCTVVINSSSLAYTFKIYLWNWFFV